MQDRAFMIELSLEHPTMRQVQFGTLHLPATDYEIRDVLQRMRATRDMLLPREYTIYNCEIVPQLNELHLDSATVDELNFFAKRLLSLNEDERNILRGVASKKVLSEEGEAITIQDLINMTYCTGTVSVISNVGNDEQLGAFVIESELQEDVSSVPENATYLLDKEKIGRLQRKLDGGVYVGNLYVCTEHFEMPKVYDGVTLPEVEPEEWFVFRLLVVKATKGNDVAADSAEWIRLPMTPYEMDFFAKQHNGLQLKNCVCCDFESSVPQITSETFASMKDIEKLNDIAWRLSGMSPEEQTKFKAILESQKEEGLTVEGVDHVAKNLHRYEFSAASDTPGAFFKEYLLKHMDSRFDPEWLDTIMSFREGNELLSRLGARMTDYGVVSSYGGSLFQLMPYQQEQAQAAQSEAPEDDIDEDTGITLQM